MAVSGPVFAYIEADMTAPDDARLREAIQNLRESLAANEQAGQLVAGISRQDAEALLQATVYNTRQDLDLSLREIGSSFAQSNLRFLCGLAASSASYPLEDLGLEINLPNSGDIGDISWRHSFTFVSIPVQQADGSVAPQNYLIDPTFRQFCDASDLNNDISNMAGYFLSRTGEGTKLAEQILRDGYFELTPENAKLYLDSFHTNNPVFANADTYVAELGDKRHHYDDYSREEFAEWGMPTSLLPASPAEPPPPKTGLSRTFEITLTEEADEEAPSPQTDPPRPSGMDSSF